MKLLSNTDDVEILAISGPMTYNIQRNEFVESHFGSIQTKFTMPATLKFRIFCIPVHYPKIWRLKYTKV